MMKNFSNQQVSIFLIISLIVWITEGTACQGTPLNEPQAMNNSRQIIHRAAEAVEQAWDEFHSAAIGGTLASPLIQAQIEQQLHETRFLLMEARKAERRSDARSVIMMTDKAFDLSRKIVKASREKKL